MQKIPMFFAATLLYRKFWEAEVPCNVLLVIIENSDWLNRDIAIDDNNQ